LIGAVGLITAGLVARKTASLRFVVFYGLVYVFLLIPVKLCAISTLREASWRTRRLAGRVAQTV
jgi:hypothetical protein